MHDDYQRFFHDVGIDPHIVRRLQSIYSCEELLRIMPEFLKQHRKNVRTAMHPDKSHNKATKAKLEEEFKQHERKFDWMNSQLELFLAGEAPATSYINFVQNSGGTSALWLNEEERRLLIQWAQKRRGDEAAYAYAIIQVFTGKSLQAVADEFGLDLEKLQRKTRAYIEDRKLLNLE